MSLSKGCIAHIEMILGVLIISIFLYSLAAHFIANFAM